MELDNPTESIYCLTSFRDIIENDIGSNCPNDDEFLIRFLRAKDGNLEAALKALQGYFTMRKAFPTNFHPVAVQQVLESGMVSVLKHRDQQGRHIFYFRTYLWDTNTADANDVFIACTLVMEEMLCSEETQINGIVFIHDLNGLSWRHCFTLGPNELKRIYRIKGGFPARFKYAHAINPNKPFRILSAIGHSFLPAKMLKRFKVYEKDLTLLYESIPRCHLPISLGGDLSEDEALDHSVMERLISRDEYFKSTSTIICEGTKL